MPITGDIALKRNQQNSLVDVSILLGDLANDSGFETAVILSLFTDRRADDSDALPSAQADKRGWWGDAVPIVDNDFFGSRLWLLAREKQVSTVLPRAEKYVSEALQWMVDDGVASKIDVAASIVSPKALLLSINIWRPSSAVATSFKFNLNWAAQAGLA